MNNDEIRMRVYKCALSFATEGYFIARETILYREFYLLLRHKNGNQIKIKASDKEIKVYKNGKIIKKVS